VAVEAVGFGFEINGLGSVTATVVDLYVCWKPGFRIALETSRSPGLNPTLLVWLRAHEGRMAI